jgi:hypothetical protein
VPASRFTVSAERTAAGWLAHCPELDISCEGANEDEARRAVVDAIGALHGFGPTVEVDARPPEPARVQQVVIRPPRQI